MVDFRLPASHSDAVEEKRARIRAVRPPTPTPPEDELTWRKDEEEYDCCGISLQLEKRSKRV